MSNQAAYPVSERWQVSENGRALEAQLRFPNFKKTWVSVLHYAPPPPDSFPPSPVALMSKFLQMTFNLGEERHSNSVLLLTAARNS